MTEQTDALDHPGKLELFRANVRRSLLGQAGQARLRELREALLALPEKRLEPQIFAEGTNDTPRVCALGAWALMKANGDVQSAHAMVPSDGDDHDTYEALKTHGWPRLVVLETVYVNDEGRWNVQTPEQRYAFVLKWVEENLLAERARTP